MSYYVADNEAWRSVSDPSSPPYIHIPQDTPEVNFVGAPGASYRLNGATPRPGADTTHTVAVIEDDLQSGSVVCAIHVEKHRVEVDDRRSPNDTPRCEDDAFERFRSALDEILIPVYLDDAVETLSEPLDGLIAIHTAQYDDRVERSCTYFRTSVFHDKTLLLEEERGSL